MTRWLTVALVLSGCWSGTPSTANRQPFEASPATDYPLNSRWRGTYVCAQGQTAVELELRAGHDGALDATFAFGPTPEHPEVARGKYRMTGKIKRSVEGTFAIELAPVEWLVEPAGYAMVSLRAQSSRKWTRLTGNIDHPSCGVIDVRRQ